MVSTSNQRYTLISHNPLLSIIILIFSLLTASASSQQTPWIPCRSQSYIFYLYPNSKSNFFSYPPYEQCAPYCENPYYYIYQTMQCALTCPLAHFQNQTSRFCQRRCFSGQFYSAKSKSCLDHCYNNGSNQFYNPQTAACADYCPFEMVPNPESGFCLFSNGLCPYPFYKMQNPQKCVHYCNQPFIIQDPFSGRCVSFGGCSWDSFNNRQTYGTTYYYSSQYLCVDVCDKGLYGNPMNKMCVPACLPACPKQYPYIDFLKRECSSEPVHYSMLTLLKTELVQNTPLLVCVVVLFVLFVAVIGLVGHQRWKKCKKYQPVPVNPPIINADYKQ